jgi:hypothetical protein
MLKFRDINLRVGNKTNRTDDQWATLTLGFTETDDDRGRSAEIVLPVPKGRDVSFGAIQEAARSGAIAILEVALTTLRESSVSDLDEAEEIG